MSTTEERLAYVRTEIMQDSDDSTEAIMDEFMQNQKQSTDVSAPECSYEFKGSSSGSPLSATLRTEELVISRNRNNHIYQIDYEKPVEASTSVGGAVKNWIKQKIRRIIAPVIAPLVLDQNIFNASATTSINLLSDNQCNIAEFIKLQEEENRALRAEVMTLSQKVETLRAENEAARLEIIRSRKRLHREMQLILDEIE